MRERTIDGYAINAKVGYFQFKGFTSHSFKEGKKWRIAREYAAFGIDRYRDCARFLGKFGYPIVPVTTIMGGWDLIGVENIKERLYHIKLILEVLPDYDGVCRHRLPTATP